MDNVYKVIVNNDLSRLNIVSDHHDSSHSSANWVYALIIIIIKKNFTELSVQIFQKLTVEDKTSSLKSYNSASWDTNNTNVISKSITHVFSPWHWLQDPPGWASERTRWRCTERREKVLRSSTEAGRRGWWSHAVLYWRLQRTQTWRLPIHLNQHKNTSHKQIDWIFLHFKSFT